MNGMMMILGSKRFGRPPTYGLGAMAIGDTVDMPAPTPADVKRIARNTTDLADHIIQALAQGLKPTDMTQEQTVLHTLAQECLAQGHPSDAIYDRAVALFGRPGVLDAIALTGYYSMIAMVLNTAQIPLPDGIAPPLKPLNK
jgi:hypothetical protein